MAIERRLHDRDVYTRSELESFRNLGIYDENHRLRAAATWGRIGAEAVLAQLYPPDISLFYDSMNVLRARDEAGKFKDTLENHGVAVVSVRDTLAKILPQKPFLTRELILQQLLDKAISIQTTYGTYHQGLDEIMEELLRLDIQGYGEEAALSLNYFLSIAPPLPLGNSIFARDQSNVILGQRIQSAMARPIRKKEVALFDMVYRQLGMEADNDKLAAPYRLPRGETFEGGDAYVHDGVVYIGVGVRTTWGAVKAIRDALKEELAETGFDFVAVADPDAATRSFREQMDFMHLDTFSTPIGSRQMLVCEEETTRRQVYKVSEDGKVIYTGCNFLDFLRREGNEVLVIPRAEQQAFGVNLLAIDDKTMLVPSDVNTKAITGLKQAGKEIVNLNLEQSTKGYGAAHCMTFQISRG